MKCVLHGLKIRIKSDISYTALNLHTVVIKAMKKSDALASHHESVVTKLQGMILEIKDLMEDPLFIDNIHGEHELSLDQTLELLINIMAEFQPAPPKPELPYGYELQQYDAD